MVEKLKSGYILKPIEILKVLTSKDGTKKYLLKLYDNNIVECVFLTQDYGNTICMSTQVGCRMGCKFCASTLGGLVRNLTAGEILSQVLLVNALHKKDAEGNGAQVRAVTNIVLMGSGEPLDNYEETLRFLYSARMVRTQSSSARSLTGPV